MDKGIGLWLNIGSLILVAALVIDFIWVIKTALNAAAH
jgi:TM2 domain-containing membrane protein YozV